MCVDNFAFLYHGETLCQRNAMTGENFSMYVDHYSSVVSLGYIRCPSLSNADEKNSG